MPLRLKFLLLSILPCFCFAQEQQLQDGKMLYKDNLYLKNLLYGSNNPVSITYAPWSVTNFDASYLSKEGDFRAIESGVKENVWNGKIYGIRKFKKISFEGGIEYFNESLQDKKWTNSLFVSEDNPFFLSDSIASDYDIEKFNLSGGFSYELTSRWLLALRAVFHVGSLADQADPRPKTKGMRFMLNPGAEYKINEFVKVGASAGIGWLSESTEYTVVNTSEPNVSTIFLMKGLGNPELKNAIGYHRQYNGNQYQGNLQLTWNNQAAFSNFLELGSFYATEDAKDGDTDYDYKGGDYKASGFSISNRFQIDAGNDVIHNITLAANNKKIDGTWYIQVQSTDKDGNIIWDIKDQSISHKDSRLNASVGYRMDLMKGALPHLSWSLAGEYTSSDIKQYPELYTQKYSLMAIRGEVAKHFTLRKGLLSLSANGLYNMNLTEDIHVSGSKLATAYLLPAFQAISGEYYAAGASVSYRTPMEMAGYPFFLGFHADASLRKYTGEAERYDGTDRKILHLGISLTF